MARVNVGKLDDIPEGSAVALTVGGLRLALFRVGPRVFALEDRCSHRGFPLNDGLLDGDTVRCRNHGACFDLATGAVVRGPAQRPVRAFAAHVIDGAVEVELPD